MICKLSPWKSGSFATLSQNIFVKEISKPRSSPATQSLEKQVFFLCLLIFLLLSLECFHCKAAYQLGDLIIISMQNIESTLLNVLLEFTKQLSDMARPFCQMKLHSAVERVLKGKILNGWEKKPWVCFSDKLQWHARGRWIQWQVDFKLKENPFE